MLKAAAVSGLSGGAAFSGKPSEALSHAGESRALARDGEADRSEVYGSAVAGKRGASV